MDDFITSIITALIGAAPSGLLLLSGSLRLLADLLPTRRSLDVTRQLMSVVAYCSIIASIPCFIAVIVVSIAPLLQFVGLLLALFVLGTMIEVDLRHFSARRKAQQTELLWMLATAVKAGRSLAKEVEEYAAGTSGRRRQRLLILADGLRHGDSLSEIAVPGGLLPPSITLQLHAAVETNSLTPALIDIAHRMIHELNEEQARTPTSSTVILPTLLIPITLNILGFVMYYIIPKFKRIFDDFGTELPGLTMALIRFSDLFVNYWYLVAVPLFYLCFGACAVYIITARSGWRAAYKLTLGRIFIRCHTPDILRALSQAVGLGVPITRALSPLARYARPSSLRRRIARIVETIENGTPGWRALHSAGVLTIYETASLESAERMGNLPWALESIATSLERRVRFRLRVLLEFLGPLLIVAIALVIGIIVIALFLPLVKLLNDLS